MLYGIDAIVLDFNSDILVWLLRLFVAAACGLAVGIERTARSKEAGMRTHTIVCFAAALMMIVSKYAFSDLTGDLATGSRGADPARIAAQIVSGIGFLGAGIIFYKRDLLHGLTTAAGIWATAGIGMAIGSGMIITGVVATIILISAQLILHRTFKLIKRKEACLLKVSLKSVDEETMKLLEEKLMIKRIERFKTIKHDDGSVIADFEAISYEHWTPQDLYKFALEFPCIRSIEKLEEA